MKISDIIAYLIKNYPYSSELSKARVNKLIYLLDWKSTIDNGKQITDIKWFYNHYGPYVATINELISNDNRFVIEDTTNFYGGSKQIIRLKDESSDFEEPDENTKRLIDYVIEVTQPMNWEEFIKLVYSTYPIMTQPKYSTLDLVKLAEEYNSIKSSLKENS